MQQATVVATSTAIGLRNDSIERKKTVDVANKEALKKETVGPKSLDRNSSSSSSSSGNGMLENVSVSTSDLETKVRELQREMIKKEMASEKLRKYLGLKEIEVSLINLD